MEPSKYPNAFEQESSFKFLAYFVFFGLIGGLIGRVVDFIIIKLQKRTDRFTSFAFLALQIFFNGLVFLSAFKLILFKNKNESLTFDDWISSTFQGLIFATTYYSAQDALTKNFVNVLN